MSEDVIERWDVRYRTGDIPWDQGHASQPLLELVRRYLSPPARLLVPGCGRGWEVEAFAKMGFEAVGLDVSPKACELGNRRMKGIHGARIEEGNFLDLPEIYHERFDAVVEHTCYCAIDPQARDRYRNGVIKALRGPGYLLGIFLHFDGGGPPHGTEPSALRRRFDAHFIVEEMNALPMPFPPKDCPQIAVAMRLQEG